MRAAIGALAVGAFALSALSGCVVTPPELLDEGFFACTSPAECGPDQGCAEGNVYSPDFCRPACDLDDPSSCPDGVCTARGACLERCTIQPDGSNDGCASPDFTCVRTDAIRDEGVCFPVEGCSRTSDCNDDVEQLCLNDALGLPASTTALRFDNLYCTARVDAEGRCAEGYLRFTFADPEGGTTAVCYPPCDPSGGAPYCPPSTTCFRGFGELAGFPATPPCLPGVWGLPCEDDTQCLIGRCLPVGEDQDGTARRACTETCEDAEALGLGCDGLSTFAEALGVGTRMHCGEVRGEEVCVPRYDLLALCDDSLACVGGDGAACEAVEVDVDTVAHVCIRFCIDAQDCASETGGEAADYRCIETAGPSGVCMRKRPLGGRCADDEDCREGVCCDVGGFDACQRACE